MPAPLAPPDLLERRDRRVSVVRLALLVALVKSVLLAPPGPPVRRVPPVLTAPL